MLMSQGFYSEGVWAETTDKEHIISSNGTTVQHTTKQPQ